MRTVDALPIWVLAIAVAIVIASGCIGRGAPVIDIEPILKTEPVSVDADDPAFWIHPTEPEKSLILGTDKVEARGGLYVFDLDGRVKQIVEGLDRPNNVDVEYGLNVGGRSVDIAVVTERYQRRLRIFEIASDGSGVREISSRGGVPVFVGEEKRRAAPMGVGLYKRPTDGAIFAVVSRKAGTLEGYLWQYRLEDDGEGMVAATKVRELGTFSGEGEIEAVAIDDTLGFVYYADELGGIHKWHADPDHPDAGRELAYFGTRGFKGEREGIAIYTLPDGVGYLLCTDQVKGDSQIRVFRREGGDGDPHDHSELVAILRGRTDDSDGIEVTSTPLGPRFPNGLLVVMNSASKDYVFFGFPEL